MSLRSLSVKNFAVVSELGIELSPGLNVFTGETGAGKSILIEALGFLLGARASADWLRAGAARLEAAGVFDASDVPQPLRAKFKIADGSVSLRRELDASGKTRAFLHNQPVPLVVLSELGDGLVDFHGQHEHQRLLKPAVQLDLLDRFGDSTPLRDKVSAAYEAWKKLESELSALQLSEEERLRRVDLYRFQLTEIDEARLKPGEEEELEAALPRLKNAGRLNDLSAQAYDLLYHAEGSVQENLMKAQRSLEELSRLDASMEPEAGALDQALALVRDVSSRMSGYLDKISAGGGDIDQVLSRLDRIQKLRKKYGPAVEDVLAYRDRIGAELGWLENSAERAAEVAENLSRAKEELERRSLALHKARMAAASELSKDVIAQLKGLGLGQPKFSVSVEMEEESYGPTGADRAEFLIAPNPGEPLKPLKSIASGGEISRVMLALKTVLGDRDDAAVMVFDEVDAGVGGEVGRAVGKRLADLGRTHQILCVTHLPQVASFASRHFHVSKEVAGGRTFARVEPLDGDRRLEAIARMLGGMSASEAGRKHARELLEASR